MRRKTLTNTLSACYPKLSKEELGSIIDQTLGKGSLVRGETLTTEEFCLLAKALESYR